MKLTLSFRSTDDVLHAVDRVFAAEPVRRGLTFAGDPIQHNAIRAGAPGYVEVWPSLGAGAVDEPDDWTRPSTTRPRLPCGWRRTSPEPSSIG